MSSKYAISNEEIDEFFSIIPNLLKKDELQEAVEDGPLETRTNIIYLTTRCDYECEYCYELEARGDLTVGVDVDENHIDEFLKEISLREEGLNSAIVIFGGEPFLRYDLVEYMILRAISMKKKGGFNFNAITNGNWISRKDNIKKLKALIYLCEQNHCQFSLTVSYDHSGNERRVTKNGKQTTKQTIECFQKLHEYRIPFEISYTVHQGNMNTLEFDIKEIHKKFQPHRVKLSWAYSDLDKVLGEGEGFKFQEAMKQELLPVYRETDMPICYMVCEECQRCDFAKHAGHAYMSPTKGLKYSEAVTKSKFQLF